LNEILTREKRANLDTLKLHIKCLKQIAATRSKDLSMKSGKETGKQ